MKIAVLHECFLNKDHIQRLQSLGDVAFYKETNSEAQLLERLKDVDIAIWDGFLYAPPPQIEEKLPKLQLIVLPHTGFFMFDREAFAKKGIKIANAPGFSKESVAELVIGLMFAVNRKIPLMDRLMRKAPFELDPTNKEQEKYWGFNVKGKTMGILGLGKIGSTVAELALGLGMKVIAANRSSRTMKGVEMMSKEEVLKRADVVSINVTSTKETENFIAKKELELMKPTAILINVDQGHQVDTQALYNVLKENKIAGAGVDVVNGLTPNHPLLALDNVVLTAHAGSYTDESFRENLPELVVSAIEGFVHGTPTNLIN